MFQEIEADKPRSHSRDFLICCALGASTLALLIYRAIRMQMFITSWGWVHFGIALVATAVAAFHFVTQERNLSSNSDRIDETVLRRLRSSTEWLYIAFNAAVFGVMYFVNPSHIAR